jgi:hypothetical protein
MILSALIGVFLAVLPELMVAQAMQPTASGMADHAAEIFLDRAYTVRDHAVDVLRDEAKQWAATASPKFDHSREFLTSPLGVQADGTAYIDLRSRSVVVSVTVGVRRIIGDRDRVCASQLRILDDYFFWHGKDLNGRHLRSQQMIDRFGTAGSIDSSGARAAADALLRRMRLSLIVVETDPGSFAACWEDVATRTIHSGALWYER